MRSRPITITSLFLLFSLLFYAQDNRALRAIDKRNYNSWYVGDFKIFWCTET